MCISYLLVGCLTASGAGNNYNNNACVELRITVFVLNAFQKIFVSKPDILRRHAHLYMTVLRRSGY